MSIGRIRIDTSSTATAQPDPYEVGYGRPPKAHQFKPGQSGNPKGKSKGSRNFKTDVKAVLKEPVKITRDGKAKRVSTQLASLMRLREKALSGDARALDRLLALAQDYNSEDLAQTAVTMSDEDAAVFDVLTTRVRSGAISVSPDVTVRDGRSHAAADAEAEDGDAK
jgi:hypothetical protein